MVGRPTLQDARSSLRRQYLMSLSSIVLVCALVALICAASVVWASRSIQQNGERVTALQVANGDIRQNMSDASAGLHNYILSGDEVTRAPYTVASTWLPLTQRKLMTLAG